MYFKVLRYMSHFQLSCTVTSRCRPRLTAPGLRRTRADIDSSLVSSRHFAADRWIIAMQMFRAEFAAPSPDDPHATRRPARSLSSGSRFLPIMQPLTLRRPKNSGGSRGNDRDNKMNKMVGTISRSRRATTCNLIKIFCYLLPDEQRRSVPHVTPGPGNTVHLV